MKQNIIDALFFQKIIQMEFPRTECRKHQWKKVWGYLHYGLIRVLSDANMRQNQNKSIIKIQKKKIKWFFHIWYVLAWQGLISNN